MVFILRFICLLFIQTSADSLLFIKKSFITDFCTSIASFVALNEFLLFSSLTKQVQILGLTPTNPFTYLLYVETDFAIGSVFKMFAVAVIYYPVFKKMNIEKNILSNKSYKSYY